jgi:hypothetical protein
MSIRENVRPVLDISSCHFPVEHPIIISKYAVKSIRYESGRNRGIPIPRAPFQTSLVVESLFHGRGKGAHILKGRCANHFTEGITGLSQLQVKEGISLLRLSR